MFTRVNTVVAYWTFSCCCSHLTETMKMNIWNRIIVGTKFLIKDEMISGVSIGIIRKNCLPYPFKVGKNEWNIIKHAINYLKKKSKKLINFRFSYPTDRSIKYWIQMKMFANYLLFACEGLMCCIIETYHRKSFAGEQEVLRKPLLFFQSFLNNQLNVVYKI